MARMPGAQWRPTSNCTRGGQEAHQGVVLHVMAGTLAGSDAWFKNPKSQASAHFGVGKDGRIFQWVDTADRAWHAMAANRTWLGIEHEGQGGDSLTPAQLAASARVIRWMHETHGIPLESTDSVSGRGIGWHGMGGSAWGGHTACPGTPIRQQRPALIAAAKNSSSTTKETDDMDLNDQITLGDWVPKAWPRDTGLRDGKIGVGTALGSGYAHARAAHEGVDGLKAQVAALAEQVAALAAAVKGR